MRARSLIPGRILTLKFFVVRSRPEPRQVLQGCSTIVPLPRQRGHGCESENSPCESETTPRPPHWGQTDRCRARLGAGAAARPAGGLDLDRNPHLGAAEGVVEGERRVRLDVGAALRHGAALARAAAEDAAEEVGEVEVGELRAACAAAPEAGAAHPPVRRAEGVVLLSLLGVGEHVVGALDLLEARLVTAARVGMMLARELAVGLLDLVGRGVLGDAERVVRGSSSAYSATITRAGRSTLSPSR